MSRSWFAVLPAVLLAACASTVAGPAPAPSTPPPPPPALTAEQAFGDLTTIDYCSLLDLDAAGAAGAKNVKSVLPAPDQCSALTTVDGKEALLTVGGLGGKTADPDRTADVTAKTLGDGLKIESTGYGSPDECRRYLTFADGTHLAASVALTGDDNTVDQREDLCKVEDAVLDGLVADVTARKAGHLTFPAGGIGTIDACTVVPDVLAIAPPALADGMKPVPALTRHHCTWLDLTDYSQIEFSLDYGNLPGRSDVRIANRPTVTMPGDTGCALATDLGPSPVRGFHQFAQLFVRPSDNATDACTVAKTIAAATWPKLPGNA
ncbi:hypothetical protein SAMN05421835_110168 [Amycolatopsis sacchari]|uniref:DUF3558 domain-containing protein n=1 Tax=Amycolatopsis sacchari TaxID=115433 RepID=A0A1I3V7P2_9PSEU|nr:hypothetical protein [Amycolatopsis sacchari]SFJ90973.1 hypothetical protein SAMN05421835_110168 [Amycolatopsis sacchari]